MTQHHGSRGTAREEILARFLELYVPGTAEVVHNAEIITLAGEISPQCDIVLVDRNVPKLQDLRSHRVVPAESVFGVIEVKSRMTGSELIDSCRKISAIKQLSREAYLTERDAPMMYRPPCFPRHPIFGYAFAYSGIKMGSLRNRFSEWCHDNPRDRHPDGMWIADSGMLVWSPVPGSHDKIPSWHAAIDDPSAARLLLPLTVTREGDALLGLVIAISELLARPLPQLDLVRYLSDGLTYTTHPTANFTAGRR
ncbi:MAG: DUF6602 domain-containing protein [Streptosporangiaceae bacterium]